MNEFKNIPQHVAIIMDGNGRWAKARGLPRIAGHRAGAKSVDEITTAARESGIKVLTLYTFSTENWKRPPGEVSALFKLLDRYLDKEEAALNKNNIRLSVIGHIDELPAPTQDRIRRVISSTQNNSGMILNLALNYGSRAEILDAVRAVALEVKSGSVPVEQIDEKMFSGALYTKGLPDPDLLIRTSGEYRISNFLLWQISYSEIYITQKLWPDFRKADLKKAVMEYQNRERRYGG
ncbi:MAG: isoprenyl transferase [Candidatus Omnitrophota bacterium]|nr:isoprenyl transferase [Candidatus Omnitrophota bacterium]